MNIDIEALATALAPKIAAIMDPEALWSAEDVASYLRCSDNHLRNRLYQQRDFPRPIRLPSTRGQGHPKWIAREIREWALCHQERRA